MPKLLTTNFKTHSASQFLESFTETSNTIYYIGAHRSIPFTDDNNPPSVDNTMQGRYYNLYDDLIFGKHLSPNDVKHMIKNYVWTSGTYYAMYDDISFDLETKNFFVVSPESGSYHIFKCLNNYGGIASTSQPLFSETSADDQLYTTSDGYQWKYMYTIDQTTYSKFATTEFVPIIPNANVSGNAVSGAINSIIITNPGSQYNSYATGTIKESTVGGNTLVYALSSDKFLEYDVTVANVTGFKEEKVTSLYQSKTSNGIVVAVFTANNTVRVVNVDRAFTPSANLYGVSSNTTSVINSVTPLNASLNPISHFYDNNAFYIRSGQGAGQLRVITSYISTGDTRSVILNAPLDIVPDTSSIYEIGPRVLITGDGVDAGAVAIINPTANSVSDIEIINSGSGYTYANITLIANTGNISNTSTYVNTTSAKARAVISPPGGHGSDVVNELYASRIGVGLAFANNESGTIPTTNDYRRVSIIKNPSFANVELTLGSSAMSFSAGEYVVQANTGARGQITNRSGSVLRLTSITGFFATGNTTVNYIVGQSSLANTSVTSLDRGFDTFDQRQIFQTDILNTSPGGVGFANDELVIQTGLNLISSDIVRLSINNSAYLYSDGELITQYNGATVTANGTIIDRYNNTIVINPNYGKFIGGNSTVNTITGNPSGVVSIVSSVDNTFQANGLGYIHTNGTAYQLVLSTNSSASFITNETVIQANTGATAEVAVRNNDKLTLKNITGTFLSGNTTENYIVGQTSAANVAVSNANLISVISLNGVQGTFNLSDDASATINTFVGQTNGETAKLTGRDYSRNAVIDGSGEILYVENFSPITRDVSQTEKIKLIIEF